MFRKFLHRPALAIVLSLLILFMGGLAITMLPISQFPTVAPPNVTVTVSYPGASAKILIDSTMVVLEQAINGVPNMRYMMGAATSAGEGTITIVFAPGTDPWVASMLVNTRVLAVKNRLPPIVQREGVIVMPNMTSMLMYVNVYSKDPNFNQNDLFNFTQVEVQREIKRIRGVGQARILGNRNYAMRVELDIDRMRAYKVSAKEIMEMLNETSMIGSPGRLGQATGTRSQTIEYVLTWIGRYKTPEQYEQIILRADSNAEILRLGDVADVKLGSAFYDLYSDLNGYPSAAMVLKQVPGSNAAEVIEKIKAKLEEIKEKRFPPGMEYALTYDVSAFLDASIEKVLHTLFEAFILVSLVVFLFLGDFRSTLIPTLAVPVSLIGSFFFMNAFGLSLNLITLFALVLAIGIVVDDAIVVVEAVHEKMHSQHLSPYKATMEVVHEISGAIIAITLVMTAVFVPVTFVPGPVGVFYRQFGITMAMSIVLSGFVALTLTPVLCAMILKPIGRQEQRGLIGFINRCIKKVAGDMAYIVRGGLVVLLGLATGYGIYELLHIPIVHEVLSEQFELTSTRMIVIGCVMAVLFSLTYRAVFSGSEPGEEKKRGPIGMFLRIFDRGVEAVTGAYAAIVRRIIARRVLTVLLIGGFCYGIMVVNKVLPSGFIPLEDQGMIYGILQTPPGSTLEYTNSKSQELEAVCRELKSEVASVASIAGYEVVTQGRGSNAGTCLINLKPWNERTMTSKQIIEELEEKARKIGNVKLEFFEPPAVPGFGMAGGIAVNLLDQTNSGDYKLLGEETEKFMAALAKRKELKGLFTFFAANYPQYEIVIDNQIAMQKGVSIRDAMDNLSILVGSTWEQGFVRFGQFYKVYVQALPEFRRVPADFDNIFVKNDKGKMVPYSAFMTLKKRQGLNEINRYNLYPTAPIQCAPATGYSSGQALAAIREVADQTLPRGFDIGWRGLAFDEAEKGNEAIYIFLVVVVFVYLVLVGQYESFVIPLGVIISLPIGIFGSLLLLDAMGLANDVYAQIGLIMLVGLLGKNAILIIEFAVQRRHEGLSIKEAGIEGARLRFRPIMMTSFAFIVGLVPLVRATGAGSIGNRTIGSTGVGGMLMGTLVGVFVIPGLYYLVAKIADGRKLIKDEDNEPLSEIFERKSFDPIPEATVAEIEGLLKHLDACGGRDDLSQITAETQREFTRVLIVAKAAELVKFATVTQHQVTLDDEGARFVKASPQERRAIWREHILRLRLFREVQAALRRAGGQIDSDFVRESIILHLPQMDFERVFATVVDWARYGSLFTYDDTTGQISGSDQESTAADPPEASSSGE